MKSSCRLFWLTLTTCTKACIWKRWLNVLNLVDNQHYQIQFLLQSQRMGCFSKLRKHFLCRRMGVTEVCWFQHPKGFQFSANMVNLAYCKCSLVRVLERSVTLLNERRKNDGMIKISFPISSSSPGGLSPLLSSGSLEGEKEGTRGRERRRGWRKKTKRDKKCSKIEAKDR